MQHAYLKRISIVASCLLLATLPSSQSFSMDYAYSLKAMSDMEDGLLHHKKSRTSAPKPSKKIKHEKIDEKKSLLRQVLIKNASQVDSPPNIQEEKYERLTTNATVGCCSLLILGIIAAIVYALIKN